MTNYIIAYGLNGPGPSHAEMDEHIRRGCGTHSRVLESVWYVAYSGNEAQLHTYLASILNREDRLLVVRAIDGAWSNLLISNQELGAAWQRNR